MANRYHNHLKSRAMTPDEEQSIIDQVADQYKLQGNSRKLLGVIRKVENGRQGREFGVLNSHAERYANDPDPSKSFKLQAQWAAGTIKNFQEKNNIKDYGDPEALAAFANHYAPTQGATNDVHHLNKNWLSNATAMMQEE